MAKQPVLTPRADAFPRWYQDVLQKAQLAENGPVRGTMVIRPYGYSIWERMQAEVDALRPGAGVVDLACEGQIVLPHQDLSRCVDCTVKSQERLRLYDTSDKEPQRCIRGKPFAEATRSPRKF
jgi:hypothetical protein